MNRNAEMRISAAGLRPRRLSGTVDIAVVALAVAALAAAPAAFAKDKDEGAEFGPGCAPDRPAIAHHAGGVIARPDEDENAPIPCSTNTGWRTEEAAIVVTNAGSLLLQPAFDATGAPVGAIRSFDQGANWEFFQPSNPDNPPRCCTPGGGANPNDQNMAIDRRTGRVFWLSPGYDVPAFAFFETSRLDISDDDGKTWFQSSGPPLGKPNHLTGQISLDHVQVFAGPPTESLKHLMQGYPNVVYVCEGNAPQSCGKSLDGGITFGPAVGIPFPPECSGPLPPLPPTVIYNTNFGLHGVVDRRGTVYLPNAPCEIPYVAISHDEGGTWQLSRVADTLTLGFGMLSLDVDKEGNLYAGWVGEADRLLYLSISRDHGMHWSTPLMIGAPGVNEVGLPSLVVGERGHVAVTYYASKNSPGAPFPPPCPGLSTSCPAYANETWSTYVTESFNALAQRPMFWSATLNDPAQPTWYGCSPSAQGLDILEGDNFTIPPGGNTIGCSLGAGSHIDYYGINMAPDGTPWVAFYQGCLNDRPVPGNPNCAQAAGGPHDGLFGFVGRLVHVGGEGDEHKEH